MHRKMEIQVLCMLPEIFLRHCMADPVLSNMFQGISKERYSNMMIEIIQKIAYEGPLSDQAIYVPSHSHLKITGEHRAAWIKCFDAALNDLSIDDICGKVLHQRMSGMLDQITVQGLKNPLSYDIINFNV